MSTLNLLNADYLLTVHQIRREHKEELKLLRKEYKEKKKLLKKQESK